MTFRFELTLGWLSIVFDPQPQVEDDAEAEPAPGSSWPLDSQAEYGATNHPPELQVGHRDPWYDRQPCGFRPRNTPPK